MRGPLDLDDHALAPELRAGEVRPQARLPRVVARDRATDQRPQRAVTRHEPVVLVDDPHRALEQAMDGVLAANLERAGVEHHPLEEGDRLKAWPHLSEHAAKLMD